MAGHHGRDLPFVHIPSRTVLRSCMASVDLLPVGRDKYQTVQAFKLSWRPSRASWSPNHPQPEKHFLQKLAFDKGTEIHECGRVA